MTIAFCVTIVETQKKTVKVSLVWCEMNGNKSWDQLDQARRKYLSSFERVVNCDSRRFEF